MAKEFRFPDVGEGISEGELVRWLVAEGAAVAEHQPIAEIETDKAVVTIPSPYAGRVTRLNGKPGEMIQVGAVLAVIDEGPAAGPQPPKKSKDHGSVVGKLEEAPDEEVAPVPSPSDVKATPAIRHLAKERGIELGRITGSGPGGRITEEDLNRGAGNTGAAPTKEPAPAVSAAGPVEEVPLRGIRRASAKHVAESAARVAAVTLFEDADVTRLESVRQSQKGALEARGAKLTYLPFIIKAVVAGLKRHPYLNSSLDEGREVILLKKAYHIGIAIDTPEGLMVFVVRDADHKSIVEVAVAISELGEKAEARTIERSELKGSTFTITNFGVIGGNYGTPIVNYPEAAILGVGKIGDRAVVRDGAVVIRRILPLSLTFDHRIIHGAEAARFIADIQRQLEDPDLMLIEGR